MEKDLLLERTFQKNGKDLAEIRKFGSSNTFTESIEGLISKKDYLRFNENDIARIASFHYSSKGAKGVFQKTQLSSTRQVFPLIFLCLLYASVFFMVAIIPVKPVHVSFPGLTWKLYASSFWFPSSFLISASLTELYGYCYSRALTWSMLFVALLCAGVSAFALALPNPEGSAWLPIHDAVLVCFSKNILINVAIYLSADFLISYIVSKTKIWKKGKGTAERFLCGCFASVLLVYLLNAFALAFLFLGFTFDESMSLLYNTVPYALLFNFVLSYPVAFLVNKTKKIFDIDAFDLGTNFNPFRLNLS